MRYKLLGRTGLLVSEMSLGTNTFGGKGNPMWEAIGGLDVSAATAMIERAIEGGINFFDTANIYSAGESEQVLGQALKNSGVAREDVVVLTKAGFRMSAGVNGIGASRAHLLSAVEASLRRLAVDYLDVYMVHQFDPLTPMQETLRALDSLVQSGKVRYIGCSNFAAWQVMHALGISEREQLARFEVVEGYYSIGTRDLERELAPMLKHQNVGLTVWGALLGGILTGKYPREGDLPAGTRFSGGIWMPFDKERTYNTLDVMRPIAASHDATLGQIALAWLLRQQVVTSVIFGARTLEQLDNNIGAVSIELTEAEMDALNTASALPPEYPGWKLAEAYGDRPEPVVR
jgi:aryl-alcohol dehydrogenase-like predicted oxidoreductase